MRDDFYASLFGAAYSAYMERPRLSRLVSQIFWGGDTAPYYASMASVGKLTAGSTVVDCPCGAGPVLRVLPTDGSIHYVGVDRSPSMLRRAGKRAAARGLRDVELIQADAAQLPRPDKSADLFLSYWGLHCFLDPAAAIAEMARVLAPGGRLVGASFLRGADTLRQRLFVRPHAGDFGPICTRPEIEALLDSAGFELTALERSGPFLFFDVRKAGRRVQSGVMGRSSKQAWGRIRDLHSKRFD